MVDKLIVVDMEPGQATDNHRDIFKALFELDFSKIKTRQEADEFLVNRIPDSGTRQFLLKNITREDDGTYSWKMNLPVLWKFYPYILAPVTGTPYDKPTLFIRGSRSDYIRDEDIPGIMQLFPQAQVITIEGAGHWVHADQPAALLDALKSFLGPG
jgi:pimeloyl-ACP methyl ester carboxylesterase